MNINSLGKQPTRAPNFSRTPVPEKFKKPNATKFTGENTNVDYPFNSDEHLVKEVKFVSVSSRDRNVDNYPNPNRYTVGFDEIKNIHSIELINSVVPNLNNILNEPYILLKIDQITDTFISNDTAISNSFAIMNYTLNNTTAFASLKKCSRDVSFETVYYGAPKKSLDKMSISLLKSTGELFDFGISDTNPPTEGYQNLFVFKITTLTPKRSNVIIEV